MDLESKGWPELPTVGSRIEFRGGDIVLQVLGACTVVRADHVRNAVGRPGGRVILQTDKGELVSVTLSNIRNHAVLIEDGLSRLNLEAQVRWAAEHG